MGATRWLSCLALLAAFGLSSCDSGDSGSGTTIDLGSNSKVASSLSEAEAIEACEKATAKMESQATGGDDKHLICLTAGLIAKAFSNDSVDVCNQAYDECMTAEPEEGNGMGDGESGDDCADTYEDLQDCDATLGEIEACLNDMMAAGEAANEQLKGLSCSSSQEELEAVMNEEPDEPASCTTLNKKCPDLLGGNGTSGREPRRTEEDPMPTEPAPE
jgi:hypothetical protein